MLFGAWGRAGRAGQYVCTEWQPGETTASTGWLESLLSHQTSEDFSVCCDRRFFFSFSVNFFLLLQNVVELQKSLLVLGVVDSQTLKLS